MPDYSVGPPLPFSQFNNFKVGYPAKIKRKPNARPYLMKTNFTGRTRIYKKQVAEFRVSCHFQDMGMTANKYIRRINLQIRSDNWSITRWRAANVRHPDVEFF